MYLAMGWLLMLVAQVDALLLSKIESKRHVVKHHKNKQNKKMSNDPTFDIALACLPVVLILASLPYFPFDIYRLSILLDPLLLLPRLVHWYSRRQKSSTIVRTTLACTLVQQACSLMDVLDIDRMHALDPVVLLLSLHLVLLLAVFLYDHLDTWQYVAGYVWMLIFFCHVHPDQPNVLQIRGIDWVLW